MSYRERLQLLLQDATLRQRMGKAALDEARQRSWESAMDCLMQGYQEVVQQTCRLAAA